MPWKSTPATDRPAPTNPAPITTGSRSCNTISSVVGSHCRVKWNTPVLLSNICAMIPMGIEVEPKLTARKIAASSVNPNAIKMRGVGMVWMVARHDFIDAFCVAIFIDLYLERLPGRPYTGRFCGVGKGEDMLLWRVYTRER